MTTDEQIVNFVSSKFAGFRIVASRGNYPIDARAVDCNDIKAAVMDEFGINVSVTAEGSRINLEVLP